jgi:hypothetical protein
MVIVLRDGRYQQVANISLGPKPVVAPRPQKRPLADNGCQMFVIAGKVEKV